MRKKLLSFIKISTHDLTRRSTNWSEGSNTVTVFQLTTSRGGRRIIGEDGLREQGISTHDLTRRSTRPRDPSATIEHFNSRPHEEVDHNRKLC